MRYREELPPSHPVYSGIPSADLMAWLKDWQIGPSGRRPCGRASGLEQPLMPFTEYCGWRLRGSGNPLELPPPHAGGTLWSTVQLVIPEDLDTSCEAAHQFIRSIHDLSSHRLSFEAVGTAGTVALQFGCADKNTLDSLSKHLGAVYPGLGFKEDELDWMNAWMVLPENYHHVTEFGLDKGFLAPIQILSGKSKLDPWNGLVAALSRLEEEEVGLVQIIFRPVLQNWSREIRNLQDLVPFLPGEGFALADQMMEKVSPSLFAVRLRVGGSAKTNERVQAIVSGLTAPFAILQRQGGNKLVDLAAQDDAFSDLDTRDTRVTGMILSSEELASLLHIPPESAHTEKLVPPESNTRTKAAPSSAVIFNLKEEVTDAANEVVAVRAGKGALLGVNAHDGDLNLIAVTNEQRIKHTYVIGASGSGKSTLLLNLILQDMQRGDGLALLDPHGDLVEDVLALVPDHRREDVILFDPADQDYPVGLNVLSARTETERNLLASDLVATFQRLSTSWGDQMTAVLSNAILAILESDVGGTLVDLRRFLIEEDFREAYLDHVRDDEIVYFWKKTFPLLTGQKSIGPIITRLNTFLRPKVIRHVVGQPHAQFEFGDVLNSRKIFLAKLAQGLIGEDNSHLLGTLLVSMIHQHAIARQAVSEHQRPDFFLYLDEFHHFVTPSMSSILTGARKYHLGLILAHQEFQQLRSRNADVAGSVLANPFTRICFRLGDEDAGKFADGFSFFEEDDLKALAVGQAICRLETVQNDFNLTSLPVPEVDKVEAETRRQEARLRSRQKYATSRAEVEAYFAEQLDTTGAPKKEGRRSTTGVSSQQQRRVAQEEPDPLDAVFEGQQASPQPPQAAHVEVKLQPGPPKPHPRPESFPRTKPSIPPDMGRGDSNHKRIQKELKLWGHEAKYFSEIEKVISGGKVDVSLEKEGKPSIAIEIGNTDNAEHEFENIEKCLKAGYAQVLHVAVADALRRKLTPLLPARLSPEQCAKVRLMSEAECVVYLRGLAVQAAGSTSTSHGRTVNTNFKAISSEEQARRIKEVGDILRGRRPPKKES